MPQPRGWASASSMTSRGLSWDPAVGHGDRDESNGVGLGLEPERGFPANLTPPAGPKD